MNRIFGLLRLDGHHLTPELFERCPYVSPWWHPDHEQIWIHDAIGFSVKQRFVTPQCYHGLQPYHSAQCTIVADVYLTERESLIQILAVNPMLSDGALILEAYLKWGTVCTRYLKGQFVFALWDARKQQLFLARDQLGQRSIFYAYKAHDYFIFSNEFSPFRQLISQLTINDDLFLRFAFDNYPSEETSYKEVNKLDAAQQLIFKPGNAEPRLQHYWKLEKKSYFDSSYRTRENYYEDFRERFKQATLDCLRSDYPLSAQLSGGLDSASVAAQAALILNNKGQLLHTFTHIPYGLSGTSYRNRDYNEALRVQTMQRHYPNIQSILSAVSPDSDIFEKIRTLHPYIDQPLRNIFNFNWYLDSFIHMRSQNARILLTGQQGNATISWSGLSLLHYLKIWGTKSGYWFFPYQTHNGFLNYLAPSLLYSNYGKKIIRKVRVHFSPHRNLLSSYNTASLRAALSPIHLWYGMDVLDPTADISLTEFCYNLPQWIFYKSRKPLQRRLLVREGLQEIVPGEIRNNLRRGEQSGDWYLQYNIHKTRWYNQSLNWSKSTQKKLNQIYDVSFLHQLFSKYNFIDQAPDLQMTIDISARLVRFLSAGFYMNDLDVPILP